MMLILSRIHARNLVRWAADKPEVFLLSADLTSSCEADLFKAAYPDRFLSMGIAEQNMVSFAGGMAREGLVPLIHTFGVFIYRRAYDQIAMSVAYPNLPVKMFGFLPGVLTPGGATHQAIEDISVMRSLPNMTILDTGDATETEDVLDIAYKVPGPVYVRQLRGEVPRLFLDPMEFGVARKLSKGKDFVMITCGICTEEAMRAVQALKKAAGVRLTHYHVSTLKPFDYPQIIRDIGRSEYGAITLENHSVIGGLGSIVADAMAAAGCKKKLYKLGLQDTFVHGASKRYLMQKYGLDASAVIRLVAEITGRQIEVSEKDLTETYTPDVHSYVKAEAL